VAAFSYMCTGACYEFFLSLDYSKNPQGRNLKCPIFIQHFFKIVLYWCLDLIRHNIGTPLKHNKYIFDSFLSSSLPICNLKAMLHRICHLNDLLPYCWQPGFPPFFQAWVPRLYFRVPALFPVFFTILFFPYFFPV
jgi:hypothetical protein